MGYVLPVNQHIAVGGLHGDDGLEYIGTMEEDKTR